MGHVLEIYFWVEMSELDENHRRRGLDKKLAIWADAPSARTAYGTVVSAA